MLKLTRMPVGAEPLSVVLDHRFPFISRESFER